MRPLKLLNQKGFTLPEILIAAALMGGVALVTAKLMGDQASNQAHLKNAAELSGIVTRIEMVINNPAHCKAAFLGRAVGVSPAPAAPTPIGTTAVIETVIGDGLRKVLIEGTIPNIPYTLPDNGAGLQVSYYGGSIVDLVLNFQHINPGFLSRHRGNVVKRIPFVAKVTGGVIVDCGPVLNDAEAVGQKKMCDALGGSLGVGTAYWDGTKCVLNEQKCGYGKVVTRMTSLGGIICEDIASQVNLNELFETSTKSCVGKPNLQIIRNASGKFEVNCY